MGPDPHGKPAASVGGAGQQAPLLEGLARRKVRFGLEGLLPRHEGGLRGGALEMGLEDLGVSRIHHGRLEGTIEELLILRERPAGLSEEIE